MKIDISDLEGVRLLAEYADAERCFHIYDSPLAAARPVAAWSFLPMGFGVGETLSLLDGLDVDDVPADVYRLYHHILAKRRELALAAWRSHLAAKEGRTHVH